MPKRLGHTPAPAAETLCCSGNWFLHLLLSPCRLYHYLFYTCRPDTIHSKTRDNEWRMLRSQWRWLQAVFSYLGPPSHVLWYIKYPLLVNMIVLGVAVFDAYSPNLQILVKDGNTSAVSLAWRLSSFTLALLLTFRINRSYDRWWTGRQAFAGVGNAATSVATMATLWVTDPALQAEIVRWAKVWHWSIYQLLTREALHPTAAALLSDDELAFYAASRKGRQLVTTRLRQLVGKAGLSTAQFLQMDGSINKGITDQGMCARIMFQAMPYAITLLCTGFLEIWLLLMPFGLIRDVGAVAGTGRHLRTPAFEVLLVLLANLLLLGVDEVANQLEQPFPYMPLLDICETTLRDIDRLGTEAAVLEDLGSERLLAGSGFSDGGCLKQRGGGGGGLMTAAAVAAAAAAAAADGVTEDQHCIVVDMPPAAAAVHGHGL